MTYNEACHIAREHTHRTGDSTKVILDHQKEDYFWCLSRNNEYTQKEYVEIVKFVSTKYGTVEARDL